MERFPKNARVCFLGDSITHGNNFVQRVIAYYKKHFPEDRVKFWNCGVSGGSAGSAKLYLADDLLPIRPTHVAVMLGVNDSARHLLERPVSPEREKGLDAALDAYKQNMNDILDTMTEKGIKVILCTPAPYAEFFKTEAEPLHGGHALILRYAEAVREMAAQRNLPVVDYHARLSELYLCEALYNPDHVHPNDMGHYRMAECFLRAQGLESDPYAPIGEITKEAGLTAWTEKVALLRNIWASEWMIIRKYDASYDEKLAIAKDYVENKRWGTFMYFKTLSEQYLEMKPQQQAIVSDINAFMDAYYDAE